MMIGLLFGVYSRGSTSWNEAATLNAQAMLLRFRFLW